MVISLSTNGKYAISTDLNRKAILWDLQNKTYKILDKKANIYSAYFVKNNDAYMWQHDINNVIYINNLRSKLIKEFNPNFATYGEVISSNLKKYVASNVNWKIYLIVNETKQTLVENFSDADFLGAQKLANLTLQNDKLLASGLGGTNIGVSFWNLKTNKLLYTFGANQMKTFATISPDGKYIVSGDEDGLSFIWNAKTGKKILTVNNIFSGKFIKTGPAADDFRWDKTGMINVPAKFGSHNSDAIFALKFIDLKGDYLRFTTYVPYAILYNIKNPKPKKYLFLGTHPFPSVSDYSRDESIDTAPNANILVMGKRDGSGIIVYKFDPEKETLKKIWVSR